MAIGAIIGLAISAGASYLGSQSQEENTGELNSALGTGAGDLQLESIKGNLSNLPSIQQIGRGIGDLFTDESLSASNKAGINVADLAKLIQGGANEELDRGNSLIDGSFYTTDVGRQATENLFRSLAPTLSETGLDAVSGRAFAGSPSLAENAGITAFLRNAENNQARGDALKSSALSRLGGVLTTGLNFGQNAGSASANAAGTQLLTPNAAIHGNDNRVSSALSLLGLNNQALGGVQSTQNDILGLADSFTGVNKSASSSTPGVGGGIGGGDGQTLGAILNIVGSLFS